MQERSPTRELSEFVARLKLADVSPSAVEKAKELFLDWIGSALAGKDSGPVRAFEAFARSMGPASGRSEILPSRRTSSPWFAALINAASSHVVEQDDLHNASVFHPGTVVFPAALAVAQAEQNSGRDFLAAAIAGYEVGIRVGEFLGRTHYRVFHTTATAGTLGAAAASSKLLGLDPGGVQHAFGSAGTQAAGLWQFLRDGADSKQLHTAKAASNGLLSAYLSREGLTGARRILEGAQGMAAGMSQDADSARLTDRLGSRWAILETSLKWHASCRHTHPSADALLELMSREKLSHQEVAQVTAHVSRGAFDVLGPVVSPQTVHQAKFSMGTVLGLIAVHGRAGLPEFETSALSDPRVAAFREKVKMVVDEEVDAAYPNRWLGKVEVQTVRGRRCEARVDLPKGDPGNELSRAELEKKVIALARFRSAATEGEVRKLLTRCWRLEDEGSMPRLLLA